MKSLYEISTRYEQAYLALADSDLDDQTINDTIESLDGEMEEKGKNVAAFIGNLDAQATAIDNAIKQMQARKKVLANRSARLREYLKDGMERTGITEISCPYFQIKLKKNPPSVVVDDEGQIPAEFIKEKVVKSVDKTAIKSAGGCPGARVVSGARVEIK